MKDEEITESWSTSYKRLAHRLESMDEEACKKALAYLLGYAEFDKDNFMAVMEKAMSR